MKTRLAHRLGWIGALLGVLCLALLTTPLAPAPAGADSSRYLAETPSPGVTRTKTVERTFLDNGVTSTVDKRTVSLHVAQTTGLRSLQLVQVTWTGAHPTAGISPDVNSDLAQNEEYPMALFECRGIDSAAHPLTPETCWTQYADERFSYGYGTPAYPAWRSDAFATPAQRAAVVSQPSNLDAQCASDLYGTSSARWVPFDSADGTTYAGGPFGCAGLAPEASPANLASNVSLPSNETFGVTDSSGKGSAAFDIFTGEDHASLGCSQSVACSLVAVPIEGISCDPAGADLPTADRTPVADVTSAQQNCEQTGRFEPGHTITPGQSGDAAVDGSLWWSASNWRNRISVPLSFAPADDLCSLATTKAPLDVYGSELMIQATTSWAPHFCLDSKLFDINHVQTPEPQARSLLQSQNIEAAYTSDPPATRYPNPTVNAPVAVTGFGIAYDVDGADGAQVGHLNLDPRLLAKLLTESYPDQTFIKNADPALANNPLNITFDPEFRALNPGIPQRVLDSAATLLTVNTDSDVMTALTSYINADPEARAWLDGTPDPWGMTVNPAYKGIKLPVDNWPLLDTFEPTAEYQPGKIDCLYANPVPFLPLVAAPTARLASIGQDMQFALSQSQTVCVLPSQNPGSLAGAKMVAVGRESSGSQMILGVVSLGDAAREGLSLASLESQSAASSTSAITDTSGRTFVAPSIASLRTAASALQPDATTGVWPIPYSTLRTAPADASAYPGTMVVYAAVPTDGLPSSDAVDYGKFLYFTSGQGQVPGVGRGNLPDGFLPMTAGDGLSQLADYTSCAANAVAAQRGTLPSLTGGHCAEQIGTKSSAKPRRGIDGSGASASPGQNTGSGVPNGNGGAGEVEPAPAKHKRSSTVPSKTSSSTSNPGSVAVSPVAAETPRLGSGLAGLALPLLFAVAVLGALGALVTRLRSGRHGAP